MDITLVIRLINPGVQLLLGKIGVRRVQQVEEFQICSICHLINDSLEGLCHSGHCNYQGWFKGWYKCWIPMRWCCLDLQQVGGHGIRSLEWIPLPFFPNTARKVVVRQKSPTLQWHSPIKCTVATPLQLSQSPICKSLPLQPRGKSFQDPFHLPPVLLAYQHPKLIYSRWTRWPKPGAPETYFRPVVELNTWGLEYGHLLIGE